jgi:hypothetical protein
MAPSRLILPQTPAFGGPYGLIAPLVPGIISVPYNGPWVPIAGAKALSMEVAGSISTLSLVLYGTNDENVSAVSDYIITIGGTITNNDTIVATFTNPNLPGGSEAVTIPVVTADTTTTLAAKLAAAINADTNLAGLAITASSVAAVVTVQFPSVAPGESNSYTGPPLANTTQISTAVTGGASETAVVGVTETGTAIGSAITALGLTAVAAPLPAFIRAAMTTLTGTNAIINGNLLASF